MVVRIESVGYGTSFANLSFPAVVCAMGILYDSSKGPIHNRWTLVYDMISRDDRSGQEGAAALY